MSSSFEGRATPESWQNLAGQLPTKCPVCEVEHPRFDFHVAGDFTLISVSVHFECGLEAYIRDDDAFGFVGLSRPCGESSAKAIGKLDADRRRALAANEGWLVGRDRAVPQFGAWRFRWPS